MEHLGVLPLRPGGPTTDQNELSGPGLIGKPSNTPDTPMPSAGVYPLWLTRIVPEFVLRSLLPNATPAPREDLIKANDRVQIALGKMPLAFRLELIEGLASIFQTSVPVESGLQSYAEALEDLGVIPLREGANALVRTHKWPRLPFPAEMIEATQPFQNILETVHKQLARKIGEIS